MFILTTLTLVTLSQNILPLPFGIDFQGPLLFPATSVTDANVDSAPAFGDPPPPVEECKDIPFCMRTREYRRDTELQDQKSDL